MSLTLLALLIEAALGYPPALLARIGHPVIWIGAAIDALDTALNRGPPTQRRLRGALALTLLLIICSCIGSALQRALLAYLSELLPVAAASAVRYRGHPGEAGSPDTVLSHTITYAGPFDLRDWLLAAVQLGEPTAGYVHALATFATRQGRTVATVSQAIAVSELRRAAYRCPPQHVPASIRYGSQ